MAPLSYQQSMTSVTRRIREPAFERRVVGDFVDVRFVNFEIVGEVGIGFLRRVPDFGPSDAGFFEELVVVGDGFHLAGFLANPNRQRRAPEAFAGEGPIDVRFEEVAEAAVFDVLGQPVDVLVVVQHLLLELAGFDEPTPPRILDERIFFSPPAERIFVAIFFAVKQQPAIF